MTKLDIFGDERKIPKLSINVKVKVDAETPAEISAWNNVFGYIMKKPRTKLEFLAVNTIRNLTLSKVTLAGIKDYLNEEDYEQLSKISELFDNRLTADVKAFILSVLHIPYDKLEQLSNRE